MNHTTFDHLRALYPPGTPGELLAYCKRPSIRRFGLPTKLDSYARQIEALDARYDVFLTINTLDGGPIRGRGQHGRGKECEVAAVVAIVADVDAAPKEGHDYPTQRQIINALADMPLPASLVLVSGRADGGVHVYWLLAAPFVIRSNADRERVKRASKGWQRLLKAKLAPKELDSTFDLVRVLRPIGTSNKKYGTTVGAMVFQPDRRFTLEDIERYLPKPVLVKWAPPPIATNNSVTDRAARYVAKIPGAVSGQGGHDTTFRVACLLVEGFGLPIAEAMPIMQAWNTTCQPPWSKGELLHKLDSADGKAERRGYMLGDSIAAPRNGTNITRLVLAEARGDE